jgi:hypothetical protein
MAQRRPTTLFSTTELYTKVHYKSSGRPSAICVCDIGLGIRRRTASVVIALAIAAGAVVSAGLVFGHPLHDAIGQRVKNLRRSDRRANCTDVTTVANICHAGEPRRFL